MQSRIRGQVLLAAAAALPLVTCLPAFGAAGVIDNLQIVSTADAYAGATPPGAAGPYQVITAIAHGKLDPNDALNAGIVDLKNAPRDAGGMVNYSTDVVILRPKSPANARRLLFYDVVNRGSKIGLGDFIGGGHLLTGTPAPATFPSLLQQGYTIVWSGWQGDIAQTGNGVDASLGVDFPVAKNADGTPITGLTIEEYIGSGPSMKLSYRPASLTDRSQVKFLARQSWYNNDHRPGYFTSSSTPVNEWSYVQNADGSVWVSFTPPASVPGPDGASVPPDAGTIYSFVYRASQPKVNGIGFAAVRDLVSYLKNLPSDAQGHANPLSDMRQARCAVASCAAAPSTNFDLAIAAGQSQSGRFLKDFLYQGFNRDKFGKTVFDGMLPTISGGKRTWVNMRFSQPGATTTQHADHWQPGDQFPFAYNVRTDRYSGVSDGILKKCLETNTCPKILHVDSAVEWWQGRASLVVTDDASTTDLVLPANVRVYLIAGAKHGSGGGVKTGINDLPPATDACLYPGVNIMTSTVWRGLLSKLVDWVARDALPPASRHPTIASGAIRMSPNQENYVFPRVSSLQVPVGVNATPTTIAAPHVGFYNQVYATDYYPANGQAEPVVDFNKGYPQRVPRVDANGNEVDGIITPEVKVPVSTYAGWSLRKPGFAGGESCGLAGSSIPFAVDPSKKSPTDTRATLAELYPGRSVYISKYRAAANDLQSQGFILPLDNQYVYQPAPANISTKLIPNP